MATKTWFITGTSRGLGRAWASVALRPGDGSPPALVVDGGRREQQRLGDTSSDAMTTSADGELLELWRADASSTDTSAARWA